MKMFEQLPEMEDLHNVEQTNTFAATQNFHEKHNELDEEISKIQRNSIRDVTLMNRKS